MFTENEALDRKYRGYNPDVVHRVHRERRQRRKAELLRREIERIVREELRARQESDRLAAAQQAAQIEGEKRKREMIERHRAGYEMLSRYGSLDALVQARPPARKIIAETARIYRCAVEDITGRSRNKQIVIVRDAAIRMVADARPDMSLPMIGRIFNRDHTTILHSLRKTKKEGQAR